MLGEGGCPPDEELPGLIAGFSEEHGCLPDLVSPAARAATVFLFREDESGGRLVEQVLCAAGGEPTGWGLIYRIDREASRAEGCAVVVLVGGGRQQISSPG